MDAVAEIKSLQEAGKLIIGTDVTMKALRTGGCKKIFMSSNVGAEAKADIEHYAKIGGVEVVQLDIPNDEVGTICRKPYSIQVLAAQ